MNFLKTLIVFFLFSSALYATETPVDTIVENDTLNLEAQIREDSLWVTNLTYQTTLVDLGVAELHVPKGYKYLNRKDSRVVLQMWGNPDDSTTLGLLFKEHQNPFTAGSYVIEISYDNVGHVDDDDADDLDYDEMLVDLQKETVEANPIRKQMGYPAITLVGWAATPYYDEDNKKLHWAKEVKFEGNDVNTLNYNIRILGRNGYLVLNAIGDINVLPEVNKDLNNILASVNFKAGQQYDNFDPDIDEVAAVGIGGLIAGKVLAKVGLWAVMLKFGKIILFGIVALFAAFKSRILGWFKKKPKVEEEVVTTPNKELQP
ncbi:MAG: DUF2167 domain-containing protein [Bacteroidetes bacterium]|nr:DUF2167 domain-containing protein [Bacteroidota bacterium]